MPTLTEIRDKLRAQQAPTAPKVTLADYPMLAANPQGEATTEEITTVVDTVRTLYVVARWVPYTEDELDFSRSRAAEGGDAEVAEHHAMLKAGTALAYLTFWKDNVDFTHADMDGAFAWRSPHLNDPHNRMVTLHGNSVEELLQQVARDRYEPLPDDAFILKVTHTNRHVVKPLGT